MIFVIRDGEAPSQKTRFIIQLVESSANKSVILISRKIIPCSGKKWTSHKIELPTSVTSFCAYYFLMILKSPKDLSIGLQSRLFNKRRPVSLVGEGFLSVLSQVLHYYFASKGKSSKIFNYLEKLHSKNIFFIDEFLSINTIELRMLKRYGRIVYVSQDVAYNRYGFQDSLIAKNLMYKLEQKAIVLSDLVVASSERDRLKYVEMGAEKSIFYPNIYPISGFEPSEKDPSLSIVIVSRGYWGSQVIRSLEKIFKAFAFLDQIVKVCVIGIKPKYVPKNVVMEHYDFLPTKLDYLNVLSKSWIGINIGFHLAGTNERKYDYAMAGQIVFSDQVGARGDLLPHEYVYVDVEDLAAKLKQLLQIGRENILLMGTKNREEALALAKKQHQLLEETINSLICSSE